jgi:hypothetical protein
VIVFNPIIEARRERNRERWRKHIQLRGRKKRTSTPATRAYGKAYRLKNIEKESARKKSSEVRAKNNAYMAERRKLHPGKERDAHLWTTFRLRRAQYEAALAALGGGCAICGQECPTGRRLAVDHDHSTGSYRGLLCCNCNHALGHFRDQPDLLRRAADYLEAGGSPAFDIVTFLKETWSGRDD